MRTLEARDAYALLADAYDSSPNALISLEKRTLAPLLPELAGRTVADAAAGTGRWASYCASRGARTIAVDFCQNMLARAPRPAIQADAARLPLADACADVTICAFALGYAPGCFAELRRITRRGGIVLVSDIHPEAIGRGWTRSFRNGDEVIEVAHQPYAIEDLRAPSLELSCLLEPRFGPPEREIFARAGCLSRFEEASREPAIFVARWVCV
ncbi:MAG TPA: class I SAM-dependent methyltransferase [Bryobacteraceae bacterium]|nr:class I SAM-dependent methyltransferase [Bryobacteraceae bacterium]